MDVLRENEFGSLGAERLQQNHASCEDGAWSHGLVASRPIKWQQETSGGSLFPRARSICNMHVNRGCDSQIRIVMLEDLVVFSNQFIYVYHSILML
jgi:hypothetical protein